MAHGSSHVLCSSSNWRPDASGIFFLSARLAVGKPGKEKLFFGISPNVQGCPLVRLAAQDRMQRRLRAYAGKGSGIQDYTRKGSGLLTPGFWGGCGWDKSPSKTRRNPPTHLLECKMHEQKNSHETLNEITKVQHERFTTKTALQDLQDITRNRFRFPSCLQENPSRLNFGTQMQSEVTNPSRQYQEPKCVAWA